MLTLRTLTYSSMALRILLAILLGGVIGVERGMKICALHPRRRAARATPCP